MKKFLITLLAVMGIAVGALAADKPQFPGGKAALDKYITENMKYLQAARDNGIEGVVGVVFTVKADGTIGTIKIKRMVDPDLEAESIRLVKGMPKWIPADKDGTPVDAPAEVNVDFSLE